MGRDRFAELMAVDAGAVPLDEAALLISTELQPGLDMIEWLAALDMMAGECPTPTAVGVARYLFDDEHFVELGQQLLEFLVVEVEVAGLLQQVGPPLAGP